MSGLRYTVHCMPCGKSYGEQRNGGRHLYAGAKTWFCATCNAKWLA